MRRASVGTALLAVMIWLWPVQALAETSDLPPPLQGQVGQVTAFVNQEMKRSKVEGVSLAIVTQDGVAYRAGFGMADAQTHTAVTPETTFALGSSYQPLTALAVLRLIQQGALHLDDPLDRLLPEWRMRYRNQTVEVTIRHLLYQTSGLADQLFDEGQHAYELLAAPGTQYRYSPVNEGLLRLAITQVTGRPYQQYVETLCNDLGLTHTTYAIDQASTNPQRAVGYRLAFGRLSAVAGEPAGSASAIYTTATDLGRWAAMQIGATTASSADLSAPLASMRTPDLTVSAQPDGTAWAPGWQVYQSGGKLVSASAAPGFSSYVAVMPQERLGVVVLANMNTDQARTMGEGVLAILHHSAPAPGPTDVTAVVDTLALWITMGGGLLVLTLLFLILQLLAQWASGRRKLQAQGALSNLPLALLFLALVYAGINRLPTLLRPGASWGYAQRWFSPSLWSAALAVGLVVLLFTLYYYLLTLLPLEQERPYFLLSALSIASSAGYIFIMYIITRVLGNNGVGGGLVLYFVIAMTAYILCQRIVRAKLIHLANAIVLERRWELVSRILNSSFAQFDRLHSGRVYASLSSDMEVISNSIRDAVTVVTSVVSVIFCLVYLGLMSLYGLLFLLVIMLAAMSAQFAVNNVADRYWRQVQKSQTTFFAFVKDLIDGFKELSLHGARRREFGEDLRQNLTQYKAQRVRVELLFTNGFILGQVLIYLVVGTLVFAFPRLFPELASDTLRDYVVVFLFLVGPISNIIDLMPRATQMRAAWRRMDELLAEVAALPSGSTLTPLLPAGGRIRLALQGVTYRYKNEEGESFVLGPLTCEFATGELIFITGGNGSGKSTLAKLLTGLYEPDEGAILINGAALSPAARGEYFSTVFSDFYLFSKLYGISYSAKAAEIIEHLKRLRIADKLTVADGLLSTTKLSAGQRKRLALMISQVDDRPIYLFDEWAAEQDPDFRDYFYRSLLPEMRDRGKCVIAITHDDRYFSTADRLIKMEMGLIVGVSP